MEEGKFYFELFPGTIKVNAGYELFPSKKRILSLKDRNRQQILTADEN